MHKLAQCHDIVPVVGGPRVCPQAMNMTRRLVEDSWHPCHPGLLAPSSMERACEDDGTRALAHDPGYRPVVPPKGNPRNPWDDDRVMDKRCDEIERFFRRLEAFRRVLSRFDTLDRMFMAFVHLASSFAMLELCQQAPANILPS